MGGSSPWLLQRPRPGPRALCRRLPLGWYGDTSLTTRGHPAARSWPELARDMKLTEEEMNFIERENPVSVMEQSYELLRMWAARQEKDATVDRLREAFARIKRTDLVHLLEDPHTSTPSQSACPCSDIENVIDSGEPLSQMCDDSTPPMTPAHDDIMLSGCSPSTLGSSIWPVPVVSGEDCSSPRESKYQEDSPTRGNTEKGDAGKARSEQELLAHGITTTMENNSLKRPVTGGTAAGERSDHQRHQGDGLHPIPREAVSEEQYTDDEGNIVTRKVTRKLVGTMNRADGVEGEEVVAQALRVDSHRSDRKANKAEAGDPCEKPRNALWGPQSNWQ
uniref:Death domain-containing protein n=1 Tax=Eptatretus burgeri TaxID=7764 RepID=A0A8C4X039_EPTBU